MSDLGRSSARIDKDCWDVGRPGGLQDVQWTFVMSLSLRFGCEVADKGSFCHLEYSSIPALTVFTVWV
jgi:hypothetical protein